MSNFEKGFVVAYCTVEKFAFSKMLQKRDVFSTNELIESVRLVLHSDRNNCEYSLKQIFTKIKNLCQKYKIPIRIPRGTNHQNHRKNYPINDVGSYFRPFIYVPYYRIVVDVNVWKFWRPNDKMPKSYQKIGLEEELERPIF